MTIAAVLTAAGSGLRLGAGVPKALVPLGGIPLVVHAARRLAAGGVTEIVAVAPIGRAADVRAALRGDAALSGVRVVVVEGGASRQASVAAGLAELGDDAEVVLVHDAARALAPPELVSRVAAAVRSGRDAVVPGLPVADTIKQVAEPDPDGAALVVTTPRRAALRAVQTPQGFRAGVLRRAHAAGAARAAAEATAATDDAALVEELGVQVWVVPGDPRATKITTAADLGPAETALLLEAR